MTDERNAWVTPDRLRSEPAELPVGAGPDWLGTSWGLFQKAPGVLILLMVVYFLVMILANMVPLIGGIFLMLTTAVWSSGLMLAAHKLYHGESAAVGDLFAGFSHPRLNRLIGIGVLAVALYMLAVLVITIVVVVVVGTGILSMAAAQPEELAAYLAGASVLGIFGILLALAAVLFFVLAYLLYAPVLVTMHDIGVFDACGLSLRAVMRNWLPLTVYGLILIGLAIASIFTLFLAWLVLWPMMMLVIYISYRQMFLETDQRPPVPQAPVAMF